MSRFFKIWELKEGECSVFRSLSLAGRIAPGAAEPPAPAYVPKAAGLFGAK